MIISEETMGLVNTQMEVHEHIGHDILLGLNYFIIAEDLEEMIGESVTGQYVHKGNFAFSTNPDWNVHYDTDAGFNLDRVEHVIYSVGLAMENYIELSWR